MTPQDRSAKIQAKPLSNWLVIVPARLKSERLPNKPLADLEGKPLIIRVFENLAPLTANGATVIVALDHQSTADACSREGIPWIMTDTNHPSGTDRCAEVSQKRPEFPFVLNVQGDEPFVNCDDLISLMENMESNHCAMGTLGIEQTNAADFHNPNVVKIAMNEERRAIYFSRAPIPFDRDKEKSNIATPHFIRHMGVYAFCRENLLKFCALKPSRLEQTEKLEQLRALSNGWNIYVGQAKSHSMGIDTLEDLEVARRKLRG